MLTRQLFITLLSLTVVAIGGAMAQDAQTRVDPAATPSVTAAASGSDMRFTAPGAVVQMRLEVFSPEGERVFDSGDKPGNVLDWRMQEQQGALRADASYLCMVTVRELSGRLSQRHGLISSSAAGVTLRTAERDHLTTAQVQAWEASRLAQSLEPVAQDGDALAILLEGTAPALTLMAHDGTDGQVTRTRGAFSFRFGDFFSGKDIEQMRLTEEGNLGIGTAEPKVKLDVVGMISAREGLMFADGSTLNVSDKGVLTRTTAGGKAVPNIAGTGTQNRLAKWLETGGAGTLGDSTVTESSGRVGIGTTNPGGQLHIFGAAARDVFAGMGPDLVAGPAFNFGYAGASFGRGAGFFNVRPDASATPPNPSLRFLTVNQERMIVTNVGNVGIGTTAPAHRLDVVGDINTSTRYNIGGETVLSRKGNHSLFVGLGAGQADTIGVNNSFFGSSAGDSNTSGDNNSFFGRNAGGANTGGDFNSFFGNNAGLANITGGSNSFFGNDAGANTTAGRNSFFGDDAGAANTTGFNNSFFGTDAGEPNTTGSNNVFVGVFAGNTNTVGSNNTIVGNQADVGANNLNNASAIGSGALVSRDNSLVLGAANVNVGIGTSAPTRHLHVFGAGDQQIAIESSDDPGGRQWTLQSSSGASDGRFEIVDRTAGANRLTILSNGDVGIGTAGPTHRLTVGAPELNVVPTAVLGVFNAGPAFSIVRDTTNNVEALLGADTCCALYGSVTNHPVKFRTNNVDRMTITNTGLIGIGTSSPDRELDVEGNVVASNLALRSKLSIGDSVLCYFDLETSRNISGCGSSIRYKENINRFTSGLSLITRLRPVTFNWKSSGKLDVGLVAEEVEAVEPLLVTYNATGGVEGVKYERLGVVLLNAVQEQQQQLRAKDARIAELETRLARYEARLASLEMSVRQTETIARRDEAPAAALKSRP